MLRLAPHDQERSVSTEEFGEAEYAEPWKYEREQGRLVVMPPDGAGDDRCSEPVRDHLGAYRLAHPERVDEVVSEAWVRINDGTDRIGDIGVFLAGKRSTLQRPDRVPELMFEVVSPDRESRERDYVSKRKEYQLIGVLEYAILDRLRRRMTVYTAKPRGYRKHVLRPGDTYTSPLLPGNAIPLAGIL
ncbi:MAG: Uma2 family endonuclease [Isosphaeraceae bacterium]